MSATAQPPEPSDADVFGMLLWMVLQQAGGSIAIGSAVQRDAVRSSVGNVSWRHDATSGVLTVFAERTQ